MPFDVPQFRPPPLPEPNPVVRVMQREDVQWNRPIFKAPPLEVYQKKMFGPSVPPDHVRPTVPNAE
jgi:hypothetical protein